MATRPGEPTALGKYVPYPADATGNVRLYWLASSPGSGSQLVRMTGACKRAFIATIEAVIERALAPANCGSYPDENTNFLSTALNAQGINSLVGLGKWNDVSDRTGLGARLKRGCPREDWENLVSRVAALWNASVSSCLAGSVYAWQMEMLDYATQGWIEEVDGSLDLTSMTQVQDLSGYFADASSVADDPPTLRPWGAFGGGGWPTPVTDWVASALTALGANVSTGTGTAMRFAEEQLDGTPAPLKAGHEGNWFGSSSGEMVGQSMSVRRSSSAWAVLQSMLANMRYTHLQFPYSMLFAHTQTVRTIVRRITMDPDTDEIQVYETVNTTTATSEGDSSACSVRADQDIRTGLATRVVVFDCPASNQAELALTVRPVNGWITVGRNILPYLTFGAITDGGGTVELTISGVSGVASVSVGGEHTYPATGMQQYVAAYGGVTFVDSFSLMSSQMTPDWTKFCVSHESGNSDLRVPVAAHAQWLLSQLPTLSFPTIDSPSASDIASATSRFWNGWELYYPDQPNVQIDGHDAYFPTAFRNDTFVGSTDIAISFDTLTNAWGSDPTKECVFGTYLLAFPNLGSIHFGPRTYSIDSTYNAMAAYQWQFKAMPN